MSIDDRYRELYGTNGGDWTLPPMVQDEVALALIDAEAPVVPYPLLNGDRRTVGLGRLAWWLVRLVWWRWKSRHYS